MSIDGGAPKKGMSGGAKVLIILGVVAALALLVCGGLAIYGISRLQPTVATTPADVVAKTNSAVPMTIDDSKWEPQAVIEQDAMVMKWSVCQWAAKEGDGRISIRSSVITTAQAQNGQDPHQAIEPAIEASFAGFPEVSPLDKLKESTTTDKTVTMLGGEQTFEYIEGKRPGSDTDWVEWSGSIDKPTGGRLKIRIQIEKENYNEQEIIDMLESAK